MNYWLIKSEPGAYSIDDLARDQKTDWTGIRNYQARNYMRDSMHEGDLCLFYHSSTEDKGVVGIAQVCSQPYPDRTAFDPTDSHYDPKSSSSNPTWFLVDIAFREKFNHPVTLEAIKHNPSLEGMLVAKRGMRLSIQPVSEAHFNLIRALGKSPT